MIRFFVIVFLLLISGTPKCFAAETYSDCLLQHIAKAKIPEAIVVVKQACREKHPRFFDFIQIAHYAGVKSWDEVAAQKGFRQLSKTNKYKAKTQYFMEVILPNINQDYMDEALVQFEIFSRMVEKGHIEVDELPRKGRRVDI